MSGWFGEKQIIDKIDTAAYEHESIYFCNKEHYLVLPHEFKSKSTDDFLDWDNNLINPKFEKNKEVEDSLKLKIHEWSKGDDYFGERSNRNQQHGRGVDNNSVGNLYIGY